MSALAFGKPQRARGHGVLEAKPFAGRTRLARLFQEGAAKIRLPETYSPEMEAVLINTAGGLTGGDRLDWAVTAPAGTQVVATTQACERIYRSSSGPAEVSTAISVAAGARVHWLPQETIVFNHAALSRRLDVELGETSEFLAVEAVLIGRRAMGEAVTSARFRDRWRIRRGGRLLHAEDLRLEGDIAALVADRAVLGGSLAFATMFYCGPLSEAMLARVRAVLGDAAGGASQWKEKLVVRVTAEDGFALRKILIPLITVLRDGAPVPKVWNL